MNFEERVHRVMDSVRLGFAVRALNRNSGQRKRISSNILRTYQVKRRRFGGTVKALVPNADNGLNRAA
jgi:hypothetical protein